MSVAADRRDQLLIICLRCEREMIAQRGWLGREVRCPHCSSVLRVPEAVPGIRAVHAAPPLLAPKRFFNFACTRCDLLLEAHTGMSGADGHCPTCGASIRIPYIDPSTGLPLPTDADDPVPTEDPTPLHAYAASGQLAPQIIRDLDGEPQIRCPGCGANSSMDANRCVACGLPFTLDAAPTGSSGGRRAAGIAATTLGGVGLASVYLPFLLLPAALALVLGLRACRLTGHGGPSWLGLLGAALGFVGLSGGVIGFALL